MRLHHARFLIAAQHSVAAHPRTRAHTHRTACVQVSTPATTSAPTRTLQRAQKAFWERSTRHGHLFQIER
eukprot:6198314-Pleurochrysis_carterae.AAC.3